MIKWFKDLKVGYKLYAGFAVVILILLIMNVRSYSIVSDMDNKSQKIIGGNEVLIQYTYEMKTFVKDMSIAKNKFTIDHADKNVQDLDKASKSFGEAYEKAAILVDSSDTKKQSLIGEVKEFQSEYDNLSKQYFSKTLAGDNRGIDEVLAKHHDARVNLDKAVDDLINTTREDIKIETDNLEKDSKSTKAMIIILSFITIIVSAAVAFIITRLITKPIEEGKGIIGEIAEGDLTKRAVINTKDEIGQLLYQINVTSDNLEDMLRSIKNSAQTVSRASSEISSGNQDLSQRTQEQASALEETSAAIEELTATVKNNADNAQKANAMSTKTKDIVCEGNHVVKETITAMEAVTESSMKIAQIINVVNEIAFQTNLLALNAAVEAARAGEQGRGFAVVAVEVRNLAQRSADAAKEIQGLINDSVNKIQNGNELVLKTGSTLDKITESIENMAGLVSEISAASHEQSVGIEEVNRAIMQMEQVVQQNASLVEESAAASEMMNGEAHQLYSLSERFVINDDSSIGAKKVKNTAAIKVNDTSKVKKKANDTLGFEAGFEKF